MRRFPPPWLTMSRPKHAGLATRAALPLALAIGLGAACGEIDEDELRDGGGSDGWVLDQDVGAGPDVNLQPGAPDVSVRRDVEPVDHDLTELTVVGNATIGGAGPAVGVEIITHACNNPPASTRTNDNGDFSVTSLVENCPRLVIEFRKATFLPSYRVIHLPPPASPVTMDVSIAELAELQCGSVACRVEGDPVSSFPPGPMTRGWVGVYGGPLAVDYFGGEFRTVNGDLLWITGFGYFDLRDEAGRTIPELRTPFNECFIVSLDSLDQLIDAIPNTDPLEMELFVLDPTVGRWQPRGHGRVEVTTSYDAEGKPIIEPANRAMKDDIRSNQFGDNVWVCADLHGSGWLAWGRAIPQKSCVILHTVDQCGEPIDGVGLTLRGRGYGYRVETWTDRKEGQACVEVVPSETAGLDYDKNELRGEVFQVNGNLRHDVDQKEIPALEMPAETGSCAKNQRDHCVRLQYEFYDPQVEECLTK